jgi:hypothetical protein
MKKICFQMGYISNCRFCTLPSLRQFEFIQRNNKFCKLKKFCNFAESFYKSKINFRIR